MREFPHPPRNDALFRARLVWEHRDVLQQVTIGVGEVPGVDPERAQRAPGGLVLPEQFAGICLRSGSDMQAELGGAGCGVSKLGYWR